MSKPHARLFVGAAVLALLGAACTEGEPEASPSPTPETDAFSESLVGTRVVVEADVGEIHSDELFELAGENVPSDGLLVFVPEEAEGDDPPFDEGDRLRVRGTIERFDPDEHGADRDGALEDETPETPGADETPEADEPDALEDRAVIVAEEVEVVVEEADAEATPEATPAADATPAPEATPAATATPTPTPTATPSPTPTATP